MATQEARIAALAEAVDTIKRTQIDPGRVRALEVKQEEQEKSNNAILANLATRTEEAHAMATEAKELNVQTNALVLGMPEKVLEVIRKEVKGKPKNPWEIFKSKLVEGLANLVSGGIVAGVVWVAIQMLKG